MPKCKNCKDKFEVIHFNQKYCFKDECKKIWLEKAKKVQWKAKKRRMKDELRTTSDYVKEAQRWVNKFVRLRDRDKGCISCGSALIGKYDAGHFFSAGGHGSVRFDLRNINAQCVKCNQWEHGNLILYRLGIIIKFGRKDFNDLEKKSNIIKKWDKEELKEIIKEFKLKCKEIE